MKKQFPIKTSCKTLLAALFLFLSIAGKSQQVNHLVISAVTAEGGVICGVGQYLDGIELFNPSNSPISLSGYSVQYSSGLSINGFTQVTSLPNYTMQPGQYYLIVEFGPCNIGPVSPPADYPGTISMAPAGKVFLVNSTTPLQISASGCPLFTSSVIDYVGYGYWGEVNCFEGNGPAATGRQMVRRNGGGCMDTDNNLNDFTSVPVGSIYNSSTPFNICYSSNANLSNLSISHGTLTPAFVTATTSYTASVPSSINSLTIIPTVTDTTATVKVNGNTVLSGIASLPIALVTGTNSITTIVTAQNGTTTKTYTVTVTKQAQLTITDSLVAYYTFENDLLDHSGNGNHGTLHEGLYGGGFVTDRKGKPNGAYYFGGSNGRINCTDCGTWIDCGNGPSLNKFQTGMSTSYWINFKPPFSYYNRAFGKQENNSLLGWGVYPVNGSSTGQHATGFNLTLGNGKIGPVHNNLDSVWYHVVITADPVSNTLKMYFNGILDTVFVQTNMLLNSNENLTLGAFLAYGLAYYRGLLDDVRIWNRILSIEEISNLYTTILPLNFTFFNANCDNKNVMLNWRTVNEVNVQRFEIEQSNNGRSWQKAGTVPPSNSSAKEKNYTFTLEANPLISYYRIYEISISGQKTYSKVVQITCGNKNDIQLYPNPVIHTANVSITSRTNTNLSLRLFDGKGSMVTAKQISILAGSNLLRVYMGQLPNGIYTAEIKWGDENRFIKILKQ